MAKLSVMLQFNKQRIKAFFFLKYGDQNSVGNGNGNADVHWRRL